MANDSIRGRQVVLRLTNKSGGALVEGDVVIISSGTAAAITTTTTAALTTDVVGVCLESIAGDAIGRVCISGYVPHINLSASASLGDTFATHTVAKQAAPAGTRATGHFGEVLGTGTTPAAILWGAPDAAAAGGGGDVATDEIWDAAGDLVQGTGADTAARLAIGTANQLLRVNSGATAVEYANVGRVLISQLTPTGTSVSWTSIPATYNSLQIEFVARSDKAGATSEEVKIYFNNDTVDNHYQHILLYGQTATSVGAWGNDSSSFGNIPGASSPAGTCAQGFIRILQYAGTTFRKHASVQYGVRVDDSSVHTRVGVDEVDWEDTSALNRVDILTASGSNFVAGSTFRIYGVY